MSSKKNNKGKVILAVVLAVLVVFSGSFLVLYKTYRDNLKPMSTESEQVVFTIEEGSYMSEVIDGLYQAGLIRNEKVVQIYVKLNQRNEYYAGNYVLDKNMSVQEIFDALADVNNAREDEVLVTIVDGYWAKDAAEAIAAKTNLTADEILEKWDDIDYIYSLIDKYEFLTEDIFNSEHCYLEGFIYPETYSFFANTTVEEVTEKILDQQNEIYQQYKSKIEQSGYSVYQIYTLASIVMFEADTQEDMYLVSSVFHNRLNDGYPLQSSVTVCYALYNYDSWEDCETNTDIDSEYNTYKYGGLPVGPVSNPNLQAIEATLNPASTNYYYFIANVNTGKMYFASTYEEHEYNIEHYMY